ncbi:hypothetical protein ABIB07_002940, partial [Bradyrhizobium sp. RT10b]
HKARLSRPLDRHRYPPRLCPRESQLTNYATGPQGEKEESAAYSDIGLSEMSQSLPLKVEMKSVFIGV